jgi:formate/nitrite transporter FocA (FNT family)
MSGRRPDEIWSDSLDEGQRRLGRSTTALAATGLAGGIDVFFSILLLAVVAGAVGEVAPEPVAHIAGALVFGIGFVFITVGRAELFTENFLVPVGAVAAGRGTVKRLLRMWVVTALANFVGLALFAGLFAVSGVVEEATLTAAGTLADTLVERSNLAAFLSAVAAGTIMTLFTWVVSAAEGPSARIIAALIVGFVLAAPSLNHAIVGFGEVIFGLFAGTTDATWADLARNTAIATAGNLVGGVGLVFSTRLAQVRGEPGSDFGPGGLEPDGRGDGHPGRETELEPPVGSRR